MGYWQSYHYLSQIIKAQTKLSKLFKRHFCTLVYLPAVTSCTTSTLAVRHGRRIHQVSGNRIGFLFLEETRFEIHEGDYYRRPSTTKSETRWRGYFGAADVSAKVISVAPSSKILNSRAIAEELGIVGRTPCILVICHGFSNALYTWQLPCGSADEVATAFEYFCRAFYDANAPVIQALSVVEEALDQSIYSVDELSSLKRSTDRVATALSVISDRRDTELLGAFESTPDAASLLVSSRYLANSNYEDLLPPGQSGEAPLVDAFRLSAGLLRDMDAVIALLSGNPPVGQSYNHLIDQVREADSMSLKSFRDWTIPISINFSDAIRVLRSVDGPKRSLERLERHLNKRQWLQGAQHRLGLWPEEIIPLVTLSKLVESGQMCDPVRTTQLREEIAAAIDSVCDALAVVHEVYQKKARLDFEALRASYVTFRNTLHESINARLNHREDRFQAQPRSGPIRAIHQMVNAVEALSARIVLPQAITEKLRNVSTTSVGLTLQDVLQLVEVGKLDELVNMGQQDTTLVTSCESMMPLTPSDIFLSYNSAEHAIVAKLAEELRRRQLSVWHDKKKIRAGQWFLDELERGILESRSVAVIIGSHGMGDWQRQEYRAAISECLGKCKPVIPILLPGVASIPDELLFLQQLHRVKFDRDISEASKLDEIVSGIGAVLR